MPNQHGTMAQRTQIKDMRTKSAATIEADGNKDGQGE